MTKKRKLTLVMILCLMFAPFSSYAQGPKEITVYINGLNQNASQYGVEETAPVRKGRTFLPLELLEQSLSYSVSVDSDKQSVLIKKDGIQVAMTLGDKNYRVQKETKTMDVAPFSEKDKIYVPARFVQEAFGAKVEWDGKNRVVIIAGNRGEEESEDSYTELSKVGLKAIVPEEFDMVDLHGQYIVSWKEFMGQYSETPATLFTIKKTSEPSENIEDRLLDYRNGNYVFAEFAKDRQYSRAIDEAIEGMLASIRSIERKDD